MKIKVLVFTAIALASEIGFLSAQTIPKEELAFWVEGQAITWSCKKCHAVNESKLSQA